MSTLTLDTLHEAMRQVRDIVGGPMPAEPRYPGAIEAMHRMTATRIIFSPHALKATTERMFPESKNRSRRIRKKLIKRYGSEFRMQPCIWTAGNMIFAHPSFKAQLQSAKL